MMGVFYMLRASGDIGNEILSLISPMGLMQRNIMSLLCTVPVVTAVLKLHKEEKAGRLDSVLSKSVSKTKYLGCYTAIAFVSSVLTQLATAFGLYASASVMLEEKMELAFFLKTSLVYLPALWVMIGLAVLLLGVLPKLTNVVWAFFGFSFFCAFLGRILKLPDWLASLTPFHFVPQLPVDEIEALPLAVLTIIAAALTVIGIVSYAERDK